MTIIATTTHTFTTPSARLDVADAAALLPPLAGRAAYLSWVAAWKVELAATVAAVHAAKRARRDRTLTSWQRDQANLERQDLRGRARNLIALRLAAKRRAAAEVAAARATR